MFTMTSMIATASIVTTARNGQDETDDPKDEKIPNKNPTYMVYFSTSCAVKLVKESILLVIATFSAMTVPELI